MKSELARYGLAGRKLDLFPLFDSHSHVGQWCVFDSYTVQDQIAEMERIGVKASVVSSLLAISGDVRRGNDQVAAAVKAYPGRILGYAHVNAHYPADMVPELERCFAIPGFRGIKVYQVGVPYDDPAYDCVWAFARERKVPVLAHTWAGNLTGFDKVAARTPEVSFIMAHSGSEWSYQSYVDAARRTPNLYLDLTGSRDYTGMIETFVREVGAERLVWGGDVPLFSLPQQIGKVLFARIPDADKKKILWDTGARLFGIA